MDKELSLYHLLDSSFFLQVFKNIYLFIYLFYLFIWLHQVLIVACRI